MAVVGTTTMSSAASQRTALSSASEPGALRAMAA